MHYTSSQSFQCSTPHSMLVHSHRHRGHCFCSVSMIHNINLFLDLVSNFMHSKSPLIKFTHIYLVEKSEQLTICQSLHEICDYNPPMSCSATWLGVMSKFSSRVATPGIGRPELLFGRRDFSISCLLNLFLLSLFSFLLSSPASFCSFILAVTMCKCWDNTSTWVPHFI